jgi:hypothetical protein
MIDEMAKKSETKIQRCARRLKQAAEARAMAAQAGNDAEREDYLEAAEMWEKMAKEDVRISKLRPHANDRFR